MTIRWNDYDLDEAGFELRHAGTPVHLEPRALELLLYLASQRDRLVTKQELLDQVWKGRFVSDSALTAAIKEARRAIGGDVEHSPIRTVHGRGYRFVLPHAAETPETVAAAPSPSPAKTPITPLPPIEAGDPLASPALDLEAPTPIASRSPEPETPVRPPEAPSLESSPPRSAVARPVPRLRAVLVAGGLLLVFAVAWLIQESREPAAPTANARAPERPRLVLAPLAVIGGGREQHLLALSIQDLLSRRLAEVQGLEVDAAGASLPWITVPSTATLAEWGRGAWLLAGELAPSTAEGRSRLSLDLHDFRRTGGTPPVRVSEHDLPLLTGDDEIERFVRLRDAIARQVLSRVLPAMLPDSRPGSSPGDVEAYRLYLEALQPLREAACVGPVTLALLERSVARDPEFAPAWSEVGWAHYNLVSACGESGDHYDAALAAARHARSLDPRSTRALGLEAAALVESGQAESAYEALFAADPALAASAPDVPFFRSYVLAYAGFLDASRDELEEAVRRDPTFLADGGWTPNAWLYLAHWDRFLELLPAGSSPLFRYYRGLAELRRDRLAAAIEVLEPAYAEAPNDLFARLAQSLLATAQNRPAEAATLLDQLALQRRRTGARDGEVTFKIAQLYALAGRPDRAIEQAELAIRQGFFCTACFRADPALAPLAAEPRFDAALAEAEARRRAFATRFGLPG